MMSAATVRSPSNPLDGQRMLTAVQDDMPSKSAVVDLASLADIIADHAGAIEAFGSMT